MKITPKNFNNTSAVLFAVAVITACAESDLSGVDTEDDNNNPVATDIAGSPDSVVVRTRRSSQGIPDDGGQRRQRVRRQGQGGQLESRRFVNEREVRTFNGAGNNLDNADWGASFEQLQRLGSASYSDGVSSMIFTDRAGPRLISNTIVNQQAGESNLNAFGTSDMLWQWGQFIDHDLDLTDGSTEESEDIPVPIGDEYFDPAGSGTAFIPFNRAHYDPATGTDTGNPRQQENEISSWLDGSMIYGSDEERATALRQDRNSPYLRVSSANLLPLNLDSLPNANGPVADPATLFLAGDVRANEQVGLTAMHTLWVREHNRMASLLEDANPDASGNSIFEAARRLVIAKVQKITFDEYLPALLGENAIDEYAGYADSINPTIYNEFSAAAYRLGHSMVSDNVLLVGPDGRQLISSPLDLRSAFFNAPQVIASEGGIDSILRGLASQPNQSIDIKVIHTLRNFLFGPPGAGGLDLISLNIQRGRDHGLPSYNDARVMMGLEPVTTFSQISDDPEIGQSLQDAYGDVSKIDLWIGGLAEAPLQFQGSQLGPLFHSILVKQFSELRDGDRFWYENYLTPDELDMVRGTSLAEVIRANTDIGGELQNNVFYAPPLLTDDSDSN